MCFIFRKREFITLCRCNSRREVLREFCNRRELKQIADRHVPAFSGESGIEGSAPLTPIQQRFFEEPGAFELHYNQAVMLCSELCDSAIILNRFPMLIFSESHSQRIMMFCQRANRLIQRIYLITKQYEEIFTLNVIDISEETQPEKRIAAEEKEIQVISRWSASFCLNTPR
jgi:hypothetical protein